MLKRQEAKVAMHRYPADQIGLSKLAGIESEVRSFESPPT